MYASVGYSLGRALLALAAAHVFPILIGFGYGEEREVLAFAAGAVLSAFGGGLLMFSFNNVARPLQKRDLLLLLFVGLPVLAFFAALSLRLASAFPTLGAALFDTISGLTTTGATVIDDVDTAAKAVLLWRSGLEWIGGIAVIGLALAIAPGLELGGAGLTRNMMPRGEGERLSVRLQGAVVPLVPVYVSLTGLCAILLWLAGMPFFDALCHAMTTLSTGGFSTRADSIAAFGQPMVELVLIPFMLIAAINFTYHWALFNGRGRHYGEDNEIRGFLALVGIGALVILTGHIAQASFLAPDQSVFVSLRVGLFTAASAASTTGFAGSSTLPLSLLGVYGLTVLIFAGGTMGSTTGGVKVMRIIILWRHALRELARLVHPSGARLVRFNQKAVGETALLGVWALYILFLGSIAGLMLGFAATGADISTAFFLSLSAITNAGPAISILDPAFAGFPALGAAARWVYCAGMVLGRLEIMCALVVLTRTFWRN